MRKAKILIADSDKNICELISLYATNEGFETIVTHDGSQAIDIFKEKTIDLVLLDVTLPKINGWEVLKYIRSISEIPVIFISENGQLNNRLYTYELGADDYILKPFEPKELIAKVKARLRTLLSKSIISKNIISIDNVSVDISKYEVKKGDTLIPLKPKEIQLLYFLLTNKNIVFSRDQLLKNVWEYEFTGDTRTVDVHIKKLREKLVSKGSSWEIKTIWGIGYKLESN